MSNTLTIYRKEMKAYLVSPIPYVLAVIFPAFMALRIFYWHDGLFWVIGKATMERGFFETGVMPVGLMILVPAISMRQWAEESRQGTLEHLMTMPVRTWELVLGKFLSAWTLLAGCLLLTAPIPITIASLGDLDWGPVLGGYLGALLLGGALLALGLWISALTGHQIVAFLVTLVVGAGFIILPDYLAAGGPATFWGGVIEQIALSSHYEAMGRGVIDLRDLLYFLTFAGFFLYLNAQAVENRRYR